MKTEDGFEYEGNEDKPLYLVRCEDGVYFVANWDSNKLTCWGRGFLIKKNAYEHCLNLRKLERDNHIALVDEIYRELLEM